MLTYLTRTLKADKEALDEWQCSMLSLMLSHEALYYGSAVCCRMRPRTMAVMVLRGGGLAVWDCSMLSHCA